MTVTSPFVFFDGRHREPLPEDAPEKHEEVGTSFLVDSSDIARVVRQVRHGLSEALPPDFAPWDAWSGITPTVHDLQVRRTRTDRGGQPQRLSYRPTGVFLDPEETYGQMSLVTGRGPYPRDHLVWIDLVAPSHPRERGYNHQRPQEARDEVRSLALADAAALARWCVRSDGRCWQAGTPWPPPLAAPVLEGLSASVVRKVMRVVRERTERSPLPRSVLLDAPSLVFDTDGTCHGSMYPLAEEHFGRERDTYLRIRCTSDDPDDLDLVETQLRAVRVERPGGRVVMP